MSNPILLVPGIFDTAQRLTGFANYLQQAGLQAIIVSPQPSDGTVGLEVLAWQLAKWIEVNLAVQQPISLVGYSMGGLICRCFIQQFGGIQRAHQLITLSTPHQGTYTGYLFDRPATMQMRPNSPFLQELNADLTLLQQIRFTSIWTPYDLTILPAESSRLPVGEMVQIPTWVHRFVVDDRRVWRAVAERIRGSVLK